jgi:hypothetical protein
VFRPEQRRRNPKVTDVFRREQTTLSLSNPDIHRICRHLTLLMVSPLPVPPVSQNFGPGIPCEIPTLESTYIGLFLLLKVPKNMKHYV